MVNPIMAGDYWNDILKREKNCYDLSLGCSTNILRK